MRCTKHSTCIDSFNPLIDSIELLSLFLFYCWRVIGPVPFTDSRESGLSLWDKWCHYLAWEGNFLSGVLPQHWIFAWLFQNHTQNVSFFKKLRLATFSITFSFSFSLYLLFFSIVCEPFILTMRQLRTLIQINMSMSFQNNEFHTSTIHWHLAFRKCCFSRIYLSLLKHMHVPSLVLL